MHGVVEVPNLLEWATLAQNVVVFPNNLRVHRNAFDMCCVGCCTTMSKPGNACAQSCAGCCTTMSKPGDTVASAVGVAAPTMREPAMSSEMSVE